MNNFLSKLCGLAGFAAIVLGTSSMAYAALPPVPEIDAGAAVSAMSVLGAGLFLLRDRLKK